MRFKGYCHTAILSIVGNMPRRTATDWEEIWLKSTERTRKTKPRKQARPVAEADLDRTRVGLSRKGLLRDTIIQFLPSPSGPQMNQVERPESLMATCGLGTRGVLVRHLATGMISLVGILVYHVVLSARGCLRC